MKSIHKLNSNTPLVNDVQCNLIIVFNKRYNDEYEKSETYVETATMDERSRKVIRNIRQSICTKLTQIETELTLELNKEFLPQLVPILIYTQILLSNIHSSLTDSLSKDRINVQYKLKALDTIKTYFSSCNNYNMIKIKILELLKAIKQYNKNNIIAFSFNPYEFFLNSSKGWSTNHLKLGLYQLCISENIRTSKNKKNILRQIRLFDDLYLTLKKLHDECKDFSKCNIHIDFLFCNLLAYDFHMETNYLVRNLNLDIELTKANHTAYMDYLTLHVKLVDKYILPAMNLVCDMNIIDAEEESLLIDIIHKIYSRFSNLEKMFNLYYLLNDFEASDYKKGLIINIQNHCSNISIFHGNIIKKFPHLTAINITQNKLLKEFIRFSTHLFLNQIKAERSTSAQIAACENANIDLEILLAKEQPIVPIIPMPILKDTPVEEHASSESSEQEYMDLPVTINPLQLQKQQLEKLEREITLQSLALLKKIQTLCNKLSKRIIYNKSLVNNHLQPLLQLDNTQSFFDHIYRLNQSYQNIIDSTQATTHLDEETLKGIFQGQREIAHIFARIQNQYTELDTLYTKVIQLREQQRIAKIKQQEEYYLTLVAEDPSKTRAELLRLGKKQHLISLKNTAYKINETEILKQLSKYIEQLKTHIGHLKISAPDSLNPRPNITIQLPSKIIHSFTLLTQALQAVYLVGGAVLDLFEHRTPRDLDFICAPKTLASIPNLFIKNQYLNNLFTAYLEGYPIDLYCLEPENNWLNKSLLTRDFTIAALCCDHSGYVIDPTGQGFDDYNQRLLRMIGNPLDRIQQDPMIILRTIKYILKGYHCEPILDQALFNCQPPCLDRRLYNGFLKELTYFDNALFLQQMQNYGLLKKLFKIEYCGNIQELLSQIKTNMFPNSQFRFFDNKSESPIILNMETNSLFPGHLEYDVANIQDNILKS